MPNILLDSDEDSDFVVVKETEKVAGPTPMTESEGPPSRLNPEIINNLLLSYIEGSASKEYRIEEGFVKTERGCTNYTAYKKIYRNDDFPLVVFQVTKDSNELGKDINLAFINDVIEAFLSKNQDKAKLLIPLSQCRFQWIKNKEHFVLVEVNINGANKEIVMHNSQSKWSTIGYLNCLNDLDGFKSALMKHNNYGQQRDDFSCGFFVYRYIKSILEWGNTEQLKDIKASLADPCLNLDEIINNDFNEVIINSEKRRSIVRSENAPWEREELVKFLDEKYVDNEGMDFPAEDAIDQKMPCRP